MKTFRAPGVYVLEDQSTPMPLSGVPTGVPCFFGFTQQGPDLEPRRITSLNEFYAVFGGRPRNHAVFPNAHMADTIYAFFLNGGGECYVCRVNGGDKANWLVRGVEDVVDFKKLVDPFHPSSPDDEAPDLVSFSVTAISGGSWANPLRLRVMKSPSQGPKPVVSVPIKVNVPSSDPFKVVELSRLKPSGSSPLPPPAGLGKGGDDGGGTLTIGTTEGTWDGTNFVFEEPMTTPGGGIIRFPDPGAREGETPEMLEVPVRYLPDASIGADALLNAQAEDAPFTPDEMGAWTVKTRIELENVETATGKVHLSGVWDPATSKFYLVDADGNQFVLTDQAFGDAAGDGDGDGEGDGPAVGPLSGELHAPLSMANKSLGLNFDLAILEPVPPRNPGDATSYRELEYYADLSADPDDPRYYLRKEGVVNGISNRIELSPAVDGGKELVFGTALPEGNTDATLVSPTSPGGAVVENKGSDSVPPATDYARFFPLLKAAEDVSLISCPDAYPDGPGTDAFNYQPIYQAATDYAFDNRCMVVIDPPPQLPVRELGQLATRAGELATFADRFRSTHAAIYAPWFEAPNLDPDGDSRTVFVPPSGFILGAYNRSDNAVGVWKAPANMPVLGALGLQIEFTEENSEVLNPAGVNLSRNFPGQGTLIWGARTTTKNAMWHYVNVRRLFLYVERTLKQQTMWSVFESNDERTWNKLVNAANAFLRGIWRQGGLMGSSPEEAFQVQCGVPQTMTMEDVYNGVLRVEVKIAPVRPAEFVVFTVSQLIQKQTS